MGSRVFLLVLFRALEAVGRNSDTGGCHYSTETQIFLFSIKTIIFCFFRLMNDIGRDRKIYDSGELGENFRNHILA